jgi:hypothetical protein
MPSNDFGWADDSTGPIDTTPASLPQPPQAFIDAAARAIPAILANVDPSRNHDEIAIVASALTGLLVKQGHTLHAACWAVHRLVGEGKLLAKPAYDPRPTVINTTGSRGISGLKADTRQTHEFGGGCSVRPVPKGRPAPFSVFRVIATDALWAWWHGLEAPTDNADVELLDACGLPAEPADEVRQSFGMAVELVRRQRPDCDAAAAVALADAICRDGSQSIKALPFGYDGPRMQLNGWIRREALTRSLLQLGSLLTKGRFNANSARSAVSFAVREYWLREERYDDWRPGMESGSGWTEVIQPQAAGVTRAAQMAAEPAMPRPPAPEPAMPRPPAPEPAADADNGVEDEAPIAKARAKKPKRSTERGEGRAKLIAALTKYHQYADGGCLNLEPIGNNELARLAGVDRATASAFFKQKFKGHGKYKAACADAVRLAAALKLLNGEYAPHLLYGAKPPDEAQHGDDE